MRIRKKSRKLCIGLTALAVFIVCGFCFTIESKAKDKTVRIGNFRYTYTNYSSEGVWIIRIKPLSKKGIKTLKIPSQIEGKNVLKLGWKTDEGEGVSYNIFGINRSEDDEKIQPGSMQEKISNIKRIHLPSTLKKITPTCLTYIPDGKIIDIPSGIKKNIVNLNEQRTQWKKMNISSKNKKYTVEKGMLLSKNKKKVYAYVWEKKKATIPEGVEMICKKAFQSVNITDIYIPASVRVIKEPAFGNSKIVDFHVDENNKYFAKSGQCVYNKKTGRLIAATMKTNTLSIANEVTWLKNGDIAGKKVKKLIIPKTVEKIDSIFGMTRMEYVTTYVFKGNQPPQINGLTYSDNNTFYVPQGSKSLYQNAVENIEEKYGNIKIVEMS